MNGKPNGSVVHWIVTYDFRGGHKAPRSFYRRLARVLGGAEGGKNGLTQRSFVECDDEGTAAIIAALCEHYSADRWQIYVVMPKEMSDAARLAARLYVEQATARERWQQEEEARDAVRRPPKPVTHMRQKG